MSQATDSLNDPAVRRKAVRLRVRPDLQSFEQKYEGKTYYVVKDPVCLRYYRFNKQEYFVFRLFDGQHTLEQVRDRFEQEFKPHRLEYQDLEGFARQLVMAGLVQHEAPGAGRHLFERRAKQRRLKRVAALTNILYLKIPIFDPDRILAWLYRYTWWIFTRWFFVLSILFIAAALFHVLLHFDVFYARLPAYEEFFTWRSLLYIWLSLGVVKVIHEFGHGLSCKAFGGESHEMGLLLMCLSPCLYCNVTDAWTLADKWKRIIISFAGIYVELMIAAAATFVWWYTPHLPFVNNVAMYLMILCSISTIVFNANPLMRFDGYYILADWMEVPNLREKSNRYLNNLFLSKCLGIEVPPEPYMSPGRKIAFVSYAITSWIYRWIVVFSILWMLADFLGPKLKILSQMLALASLASIVVWPTYRIIRNIRQRGRLPDMKAKRVYTTVSIVTLLILAFFLLPLPISRVHELGLVAVHPQAIESVSLPEPARLQRLHVRAGDTVRAGDVLAEFTSEALQVEIEQARAATEAERQIALRLHQEISRSVGGIDETLLATLRLQREEARKKADSAERRLQLLQQRYARIRELRAPRAGTVLTAPRPEEVGKLFDKGYGEARPIFAVGDPQRLIVRVPVTPPDYRLLQEDLNQQQTLMASVLVKSRSDRIFTARLTTLPARNAETVPIQLTHRGGGPLAVKPHSDPNLLIPLAQVYIVEVELLDPDSAIDPGQLASVKIHTRWRSAAWWLARTLANALDLGLY
jgi:putative peptide zinc metalloprotease protein